MKAVITLDEHAPAKLEIEKNGMKRPIIYMKIEKLVNYLSSSVIDEDVEGIREDADMLVMSPTLPPNTVKYAQFSDRTDLIFLSHPETKATVSYHKTVFENVPFPNLVFCFGIRNKRLVVTHVAAYKDRFLRDTTELYKFPFSNVYSDGKMCYYTNEEVHDLVQLQTFPANWLQEPFNDHLYNQGRTNLLDLSLREIFEKSQNQSFNYEMLVPMNETFASWSETVQEE